jgi:hypothetical protein
VAGAEGIADGAGWRQVLGQIVTVASLARVTGLPVVDFEYWAAFNGSPFEPSVWVIVDRDADRVAAKASAIEITSGVRGLLVEGGYPADAAQTAIVAVASQEQIREKGGKFNFFR